MNRESRMQPLARAVLRTQPDHRLVALAREGRDSAFDEIVRRYRPGLVAFAAAYAPRDSAEDVVQDGLAAAWRALRESETEIQLKPWLYTIIRNRALNARRDARPHEPLDEEIDGVRRPDEIALTNEELGRAVAAVNALPEAQRRALVRSALDGRTHDQIAAELGSTPGAVGQLDLPGPGRAAPRARVADPPAAPASAARAGSGSRGRRGRRRSGGGRRRRRIDARQGRGDRPRRRGRGRIRHRDRTLGNSDAKDIPAAGRSVADDPRDSDGQSATPTTSSGEPALGGDRGGEGSRATTTAAAPGRAATVAARTMLTRAAVTAAATASRTQAPARPRAGRARAPGRVPVVRPTRAARDTRALAGDADSGSGHSGSDHSGSGHSGSGSGRARGRARG